MKIIQECFYASLSLKKKVLRGLLCHYPYYTLMVGYGEIHSLMIAQHQAVSFIAVWGCNY